MAKHQRRPERSRLVDVAALAGVAVSTASRALNNPAMVRPETRDRVRAAAEALDYEPNRAARGLITGRSAAIAVIVYDITNSYYGRICRAAQEAARPRGHEVVIVDTGSDPAREAELLRSTSRLVDGIILCGATRSYPPRPFGVPLVYVSRRARGSHSVVVDPVSMVRDPITHLVALGHERIDWVAGPKWGWSADRRLRTAERLAAHHDIRVLRPDGVDFQSGVEMAETFDGRATAVVCYTDRQAFGFMGRGQELGLRFPQDVSVVGAFDAPGSAHFAPTLTTFALPQEELATTAVDLLLDHPGADDRAISTTLRGRLIVRTSTAPPGATPADPR